MADVVDDHALTALRKNAHEKILLRLDGETKEARAQRVSYWQGYDAAVEFIASWLSEEP